MEKVISLLLKHLKKFLKISHTYNPYYLYSGVGMGKTHLLNAIGLKLKQDEKKSHLYQQKDLCTNLLNQLNQMKWLNLKIILEIPMY